MWRAQNLALVHAGRASCSAQAIDDSIKDIGYVIEDHALGENGPYPYCTTYTGDTSPQKMDWWAITFPYPVRCNCVRFTQGKVDQGGGYWTALEVQVQREAGGPWSPVPGQRICPPYDLSGRRGDRRPFESHAVIFDSVEAVAVRLYGHPGGGLQYTTLFHMGVYLLDLKVWDPGEVPAPPLPRLFRLLQPERLAQMLFDLEKVTGVMMTAETPFPLSVSLDCYLAQDLSQRFVALDPRQTTRLDEFERLLFDAEGGDRFMEPLNEGMAQATAGREPLLLVHHGGLGALIVPVVVGDETIGLLTSCTHFHCDGPDMAWHDRHAAALGLPWETYLESMLRLPILPRDRLEAMLHLLSLVANTIAELADTALRREQQVREMERTIEELAERAARVVEQAVAYMAGHLDQPLSLAEIAAAVSVSPRHLLRLTRQVKGKSPMEILIDLRLDRAGELLLRPGKRVTDVSTEVGYSSLSHFVRLFQRRFGVTPGRYARLARHHGTPGHPLSLDNPARSPQPR